jgi:hypothetical protein
MRRCAVLCAGSPYLKRMDKGVYADGPNANVDQISEAAIGMMKESPFPLTDAVYDRHAITGGRDSNNPEYAHIIRTSTLAKCYYFTEKKKVDPAVWGLIASMGITLMYFTFQRLKNNAYD